MMPDHSRPRTSGIRIKLTTLILMLVFDPHEYQCVFDVPFGEVLPLCFCRTPSKVFASTPSTETSGASKEPKNTGRIRYFNDTGV